MNTENISLTEPSTQNLLLKLENFIICYYAFSYSAIPFDIQYCTLALAYEKNTSEIVIYTLVRHGSKSTFINKEAGRISVKDITSISFSLVSKDHFKSFEDIPDIYSVMMLRIILLAERREFSDIEFTLYNETTNNLFLMRPASLETRTKINTEVEKFANGIGKEKFYFSQT